MDRKISVLEKSYISSHLGEMHNLLRKSALALFFICIFWSFFVDQIINYWLENLPLELGPSNENLAIYGPFDWIETRWSIILILSFTTLLPLTSIQFYSFSMTGLLPNERSWLSVVLIFLTSVVPMLIISVWLYGIPSMFKIAISFSSIDGVGIRYDAASIFSVASGISWVLIVWSFTAITMGMARVFRLVVDSEIRFRRRILAISGGSLLLTLPTEFDGLRILIAIITVLSADFASKAFPIRNSDIHAESSKHSSDQQKNIDLKSSGILE